MGGSTVQIYTQTDTLVDGHAIDSQRARSVPGIERSS